MKDIKIKKFKNIHKGKRCFIVGNGPSLRKTNLDLITNEISFAMNRINLIYPETTWRPNYFSCTTNNFYNPEWRNDILVSKNLGIPFFIWEKLINEDPFFQKDQNTYLLNSSDAETVADYPGEELWSWDPSERVTKYGTSIVVSFQIAVYMGFKEIYLLGTDLNFHQNIIQKFFNKLGMRKLGYKFDSNHFSNLYGTPGYSDELNTKMIRTHELIKKMTTKANIKVLNATPGGSLEVYERINYEDIFC